MRHRRRSRKHRRAAIGLAAVVVAGAVGAGAYVAVAKTGSGSPGRSITAAGGTSSRTTTTTGAVAEVATSSGPAGVQASWVTAENKKPGTTDWQIAPNVASSIAGFANQTSAQVGDTVSLYVTTTAASFTVYAYRIGYYGGTGGRLVWISVPVAGTSQPACPVDPTTRMVSCDNWTPSLQVPVTAAFVQGDYLLKLVGSAGQESYVPLTVWSPSSHATYLLENDIYTWQAWNSWGGYSFYDGQGSCPPGVYPICSRARVASFDRPYNYGQGAADFFGNEYPLVRFVEQQGLDVTYATSADFEENPSFLAQHRAVLSLGHDECWSYPEREAIVAAEGQGVNVIFFGASPILRHVRMQPSPLGADREEVDYRNSVDDPLDRTGPARQVTGNTWSDAPASWSEVPFTGANYTGYVLPQDKPVALKVGDSSSWLFKGTGLTDGAEIPGFLFSDFDQYDPGLSPGNVQILAHTPMPLDEVQTNVRQPASDITYYTDPKSNAGVFDTGTVAWIPDMSTTPVVSQMTANLLLLFGAGPAGLTTPSQTNSHQYY